MGITRVLLLGAYGNFGRHITDKLSQEPSIKLILAGRSEEKCHALINEYSHANNPPELAIFDVYSELSDALVTTQPKIVINTCGPFQTQNYSIAQTCIEHSCHYIDLADGREFVTNISQLDQAAKNKGISIISGASSVPCLTAAVIDHHLPTFKKLEYLDSGIATAQRINAGLATIRGTLSYCGKPIQMLRQGYMQSVIGWQGMVRKRYPKIGARYLSYCDVPDLALFPERYPDLKSAEFRVSLEVTIIQWTMWLLSWFVRWGTIKNLASHAEQMLHYAQHLDRLGSYDSGFHVTLKGIDHNDQVKQITHYIIATDKYGPYIPSTPAILCTLKLANGSLQRPGAYPCLDIITLNEYMDALDSNKIFTHVEQT